MKNAKMGLCAVLLAAAPAIAGRVTPTLSEWYAEAENDVLMDLIAPVSQHPSPKVDENDPDLPGMSEIKNPPPSLPSSPLNDPMYGDDYGADVDAPSFSTQPADDWEMDGPPQNLVMIPLPGGAGLCAAGLALLASRRRR